jgi:hypothetical protein
MAKTDAAPEEKLVEVKLLRNYVPVNAEQVPDAPGVFVKRHAGEVLELPRSEAKAVIAAGIAAVTADLI